MDPEKISNGLGAIPSFSWKAGEQRTTPKRQPLEGINKDTYWCSEAVHGEGSELCASLASHLSMIETRRPFLIQFCSSGGTIEYFIGWFTNGLNTRETFGWELLRRLADLGISLSFDVYGKEDSRTQ
jgi:hypothetical protein